MLAYKIYTNIRPGNPRRPLEYVVELTGIAIIYVGLAKLSLALASIHPSANPIWPPTGYALGTILLLGYRVSPAIFLGALAANVTTAGSISTSFAIVVLHHGSARRSVGARRNLFCGHPMAQRGRKGSKGEIVSLLPHEYPPAPERLSPYAAEVWNKWCAASATIGSAPALPICSKRIV